MVVASFRWSLILLAALPARTAFAKSPRFDFQNGDCVVLIGGDFVERECRYGYLETALTSALPRLNITFRNLGCSGDTVAAESDSLLELPRAGCPRLLQLVREIKPTVVFLCHGSTESSAGDAGLKGFIDGYEKLMDDLDSVSGEYLRGTTLRFVLMTPHQFETPQPPLPDASQRNADLDLYAQAIQELAGRRGARLVDLYDRTGRIMLNRKGFSSPAAVGPEPPRGFHLEDGVWKSLPLTEDGIHLSKYGYLRAARMLLQALKLPHAEFLLQLDSSGAPDADTQMTVSDFQSDGTQVRFKAIASRLPEPPTPLFPHDVEYFVIAGGGLPSGKYQLKIDGRVAAENPTVLVGFPVRAGADYDQAEQLRKRIVAKNQLFGHCWRPPDVTALAALRHDDDETTADALARFAPLIKKAEAEIAELKRPKTRQYEIVPRNQEK